MRKERSIEANVFRGGKVKQSKGQSIFELQIEMYTMRVIITLRYFNTSSPL